MANASSPGGAAASAAGGVASFIAEKITDPAFNEALSPAQGLQVTPHVFGAMEQEGRWKSENWGYNPDRKLLNPLTGLDPPPILESPPQDVVTPPGRDQTRSDVLFAFKIAAADLADELFWGLVSAIAIPIIGGPLPQLLKLSSVGAENSAAIEVRWWDDTLEIWGGFAGLRPGVQGFGSVFGHRAKIDVTGYPYGNYLPARYLIIATGWINPVGPQYYEFHCGATARAGAKGLDPLFGDVWDRDGNVSKLGPGQAAPNSPRAAFYFDIEGWANPASQMLGPT